LSEKIHSFDRLGLNCLIEFVVSNLFFMVKPDNNQHPARQQGAGFFTGYLIVTIKT